MKHSHSFRFLRALGRFVVGIVTFGVLGLLALQTPMPVAQAQTLSVDSLLRADGTLDLTREVSGAVDLRGWKVNLDPKRGPVLFARGGGTDGSGYLVSAAGNGLNGYVDAMAVVEDSSTSSGQALYVGGFFSQTNDGNLTGLGNIAKFDGTSWSALPNAGLNFAVYAMAASGSDLYVGGHFTQTVSPVVSNLNHIAKFNGTSWSTLANGLDGDVFTLAVSGSDVYAGGAFASAVSPVVSNLNHIAKFSSASWSALPNNGLNDDVTGLAFLGSDLFVSGHFTQTTTGGLTLNHIAKFNATWAALPNDGLDDNVGALAVWGSDLYVGGSFTQTVSPVVSNLNHIAKFNGTTWSALPNGGLNNDVYALQVSGSNLYVGGDFTQTISPVVSNLNRVAKFDGTSWSALPNNGLNTTVSVFSIYGGALYVGGSFAQTVSPVLTNLHDIAKLTFAPTQAGPTFTVNTDADTDDGLCDVLGNGNGNADCTLREAMNAANAQGGANTIQFDGDHSIYLAAALPILTGDTTVDGGTHFVVLDGQQSFRLLTLNSANTLNVNHLILQDGYTDTALGFGLAGGAIYNQSGTLNVTNSTLYANSADANGGAIFSGGTTSISNSTLQNNSAGGSGGGISAGTLTLLNSTLSDNSATSGAGLSAGVSLTLKNTIIANSTGSDCSLGGTLASGQNNLIESTGSGACGLVNGTNGNLIGVDPALGLLGDNGGNIYTMALPALSAAIDAGDDGTCSGAPVSGKDERGITRPFGAHCDMGAFEKTTADCVGGELAAKPTLLKPAKNKTMSKTKVAFDWTDAVCATSYKITVKNTTTGAKVTKTVTVSKAKLTLAHGNEKWSVQACNANGCSKSGTFKFTN